MEHLIIPVISGAAGSFITLFATKGTDWLIELVGSHSEAVQKKTLRNTQNFVERLAKRVEELEKELPPDKKEIFDEALSHPSSSLLIRKALVTAASTENDDRHEILSELIAQRLTADAEDMVALVGAAACDVVSALSSRQIRLLGNMATLMHMSPIAVPAITEQSAYDTALLSWLEPLNQLSEGLEETTNLDIIHLEGLSCISITTIGEHTINKVISSKFPSPDFNPTIEKFEAMSWWPRIKHIWDIGGNKAHLTSIGALIGTLYHDSELGTRTRIDWE